MHVLELLEVRDNQLVFEVRSWGELDLPESLTFGASILGVVLAKLGRKVESLHHSELIRTMLVQRAAGSALDVPETLAAFVTGWTLEDRGSYLWNCEHGVFSEPESGKMVARARGVLTLSPAVDGLAPALESQRGEFYETEVGDGARVVAVHFSQRPADEDLWLMLVSPTSGRDLPASGAYGAGVFGFLWGLGLSDHDRKRTKEWKLCAVERTRCSQLTGQLIVEGGWVERVGTLDELAIAIAQDARCPAAPKVDKMELWGSWKGMLDSGRYDDEAALAREEGVSRSQVILGLRKLKAGEE